jgi:hypothetical protein
MEKPPKPLKKENYKNVLHIWNIGACGSIMVKNLKQYGYTGETIMRKSHDPFNVTELYGDQSLNMEGGEFLEYAKRIAPEFGIIHTHGIYENIPELRKIFPKKVLIVHYHGSDIADCKNNEFRLKCVKDADAVLCSTPDLMKYAENDPVPAYYIPNAVDQSVFKPMPEVQKETNNAMLQVMCYIDLPRLEKYLKENCPWKYEIYDREEHQVPLFDMAKVYNKYSKLIDCKIYKYTKNGKPEPAYSKAGLEALACGLEVFNYEGNIVKGLPEQHTLKYQAETLISIYTELVNRRKQCFLNESQK